MFTVFSLSITVVRSVIIARFRGTIHDHITIYNRGIIDRQSVTPLKYNKTRNFVYFNNNTRPNENDKHTDR